MTEETKPLEEIGSKPKSIPAQPISERKRTLQLLGGFEWQVYYREFRRAVHAGCGSTFQERYELAQKEVSKRQFYLFSTNVLKEALPVYEALAAIFETWAKRSDLLFKHGHKKHSATLMSWALSQFVTYMNQYWAMTVWSIQHM